MAPFDPTDTDVVCPVIGVPSTTGTRETTQLVKPSSTVTLTAVPPMSSSSLVPMRSASALSGRSAGRCGSTKVGDSHTCVHEEPSGQRGISHFSAAGGLLTAVSGLSAVNHQDDP